MLARAIKLKCDITNFAVVQKLTVKTSRISNVAKSQTLMTERIRVT